jgi:hypothetical protein
MLKVLFLSLSSTPIPSMGYRERENKRQFKERAFLWRSRVFKAFKLRLTFPPSHFNIFEKEG